MKTFYRVTSTFDDRGRARSHIDTVRASRKPDSTFFNGPRFDVYEDYFDTEEEAKEFHSETKYA